MPDLPPPPPASAARPGTFTTRPRRWRQRLPEIAAVIGASLVATASAGFVTSSWRSLTDPAQAVLLGSGAAALTVLALWFERLERRGLQPVIGLVLVGAISLTASSVTLGSTALLPGMGRLSIALGGLAALVHGLWMLGPRRASGPLVVACWAAAVYGGGPVGTAWSDRWTVDDLDVVGRPVAGFFDPTVTSAQHLLPAVAHLVLGLVLIVGLRALDGRARAVARTLAIATLAYAALELNVLDNPVGAVLALGIVIGHVLAGLWQEDAWVVTAGIVGSFAAGLRVLAAVFSGKVLATVVLLLGGIALLAWAVRAMGARDAAVRPEDPTATQI